MRTLLTTIVSTIVAGTGLLSLSMAGVFTGPCDKPISYRITSIDPRFEIATSTVRGLLQDAEAAWEKHTKKDLFAYKPQKGEVSVRFIYDQRQRRTEKQEAIATNLSSLADTHKGLKEVLQTRREDYQQRLQAYEADRKAYEQSLQEYNEKIEQLNKRRQPVSSSTRQQLQEIRNSLEKTRQKLAERRKQLEQLRQEINQLAERSNSLAQTYNQKARTFNERFGTSRKFDQATYTGKYINVYQFNEASDLRLALAHEFGHALGIKHLQEPTAIMHYLMKKQQLNPLKLTKADQEALRNICKQ